MCQTDKKVQEVPPKILESFHHTSTASSLSPHLRQHDVVIQSRSSRRSWLTPWTCHARSQTSWQPKRAPAHVMLSWPPASLLNVRQILWRRIFRKDSGIRLIRMPLKRRSSFLSCSRWLLRPRSGPWSTRARLCQGGGSPNFAGGLGPGGGGLAGTSRASHGFPASAASPFRLVPAAPPPYPAAGKSRLPGVRRVGGRRSSGPGFERRAWAGRNGNRLRELAR